MSKKDEILKFFNAFLQNYDAGSTNDVWRRQSEEFRAFWRNKIMKSNSGYSNSELSRIIQILDIKGRRDPNDDVQGAAYVQIYQDDWKNIFKGIKENPQLKEVLDKILTSSDDSTLINSINELKRINSIDKLTGTNSVVINDFLFAYSPDRYISVMSLQDRYLIIDYFGLGNSSELIEKSYGETIVESNKRILSLGYSYGLGGTPRIQSEFLYSKSIKNRWRKIDPYSSEIIGAIAFIKFGDVSGVYSNDYIDEFSRGVWDHWNTPSDYMRSTPGTLLLYDGERKGITIQAKVTDVKKRREGEFPYKNAIDPNSVIIFDPPISKDSIKNVHGLENFAKGQTPKYNLKRHMHDELMNNYHGKLRSKVQLGDSNNRQYSLQKDDDGINIIGDGVDPQTDKYIAETRLFQSAFRNSLLKLFNHKCLFCDVDSDLLLEAAHIMPFSADHSSAGNFANGLTLCTIHHSLFDKGLISIKDDTVIPSKGLISAESDFLIKQYNELLRMSPVSLPKGEKSAKFLEWHYDNVFKHYK